MMLPQAFLSTVRLLHSVFLRALASGTRSLLGTLNECLSSERRFCYLWAASLLACAGLFVQSFEDLTLKPCRVEKLRDQTTGDDQSVS
jgi:hypothetical protein